jgi:signal transduction histidine kinase/ActR/RegA family two-component response regulator
MNLYIDKNSAVPSGFIENCQVMLNNLAEVSQVPAALIMRVEEPFIEVFSTSESTGNPYKPGDKELLPGLYCERVIKTQEKLLVPNALKDKNWDQNPDIKLGMISYLGFPLLFPNGDIFGTICILDSEERSFDKKSEKLLLMMKNIFEDNLKVLNLLSQKDVVLEMIAKGKSLSETLEVVIRNVETQVGNVKCSILLLDKSGKTLRKGWAPNLPSSYFDALDGVEIGPAVGACGTAAYLNETVISDDIQTDPKWKRGGRFALSYGLKACWSVPIRNAEGKVLGTLCPYFNEPRTPTEIEMEIVLYAAYLASIAIQLKQGEESLKQSERLSRDSFNKMRSVLEGTSSESGDSFFRSMVFHLASALNVRYSFLARCVGPHTNKMMALWMKDEYGDNIEYDIRGTPSESINLKQKTYYFPEKIQSLFPDDTLLIDWEVESYLGVRLFNEAGEQMGTIVVMDDKPMQDTNNAKIILSIFASRAELEMIRQKSDKELSLAKEVAEKESKAKSEFLSRMSHELRTPMNAILGFAQLMEMDKNNPLVEYQKENLNYILSAGSHLMKLINEVLDLSKIESGNIGLTIEPIDLVKAVTDVVSISKPVAEKSNISIKCQVISNGSYIVKADLLRIKQVILNLISNAIKYNKPNGSVMISFEERGNNLIRLGFRDEGCGISKEEEKKIFDPFERLNINPENIEGTGIGLTISKDLVEMMKGAIGFESVVDEGSFFYVDMPLSSKTNGILEVENKSGSIQSPTGKSNLKKVLYIDDLPSNIELVKQILSLRSHVELLSASNAQDGIEIARTQKPDLIFMDLQMPEMDGLTAFKILQTINETKGIPVAALTAEAMSFDVKKVLDLGFDFYITKPFDIHRFLETIDEVLVDSSNH